MEEGKGLVGGKAEERGGEGEVTICAPDQKEELFHTLAFSLLPSSWQWERRKLFSRADKERNRCHMVRSFFSELSECLVCCFSLYYFFLCLSKKMKPSAAVFLLSL